MPRVKTTWTKEQAAEAARKSAETRKRNAEARKAARKAALEAARNPPPPAPKPEPQPVASGDAQAAMAGQLEIVREQISSTRKVLNDEESLYCEHCERGGIEPQHRAQLLKALDSLLDRERVLLGLPLPGSLRPAPEGRRSKAASLLGPVAGTVDDGPSQPQE